MHDAETRTVAELAEALRIATEEIDRLRAELRKAEAILNAPREALFADGRKPTENERHLLNLLSWRQKEADDAKAEASRLRTRLDEAKTTMLSFGIHDDLRCHCCGELFASNDPDHVRCGICSQVCRYLEYGTWERGKHCPALNK